jgi:hypothetical protein
MVALVAQNITTPAEAQFGNRGVQKFTLCSEFQDKCVGYTNFGSLTSNLDVFDLRSFDQLRELNRQMGMLLFETSRRR